VSKQFTAAGLLQALHERYVAKGILDTAQLAQLVRQDLNKSLSVYLPKTHPVWLGNMPVWADKISLGQLLHHSSGVPEFLKDDGDIIKEPFKYVKTQVP
jgi:CubicO group peptidase (beta-lactamase class C family)